MVTYQKASVFVRSYPLPLSLLLLGLVFLGIGIVGHVTNVFQISNSNIEVLGKTAEDDSSNNIIIVEVSGAVVNPGIYQFKASNRVDDALRAAGGLTKDADHDFIAKTINRASKLTDGQKIYFPKQTGVTSANKINYNHEVNLASIDRGSGLVNINLATQKQLEELPGIGQTYAQNIIEQRPYSSLDELTSKGALKDGVYQKIKELISIY